jgi:hypothetical protein
MIDLYTHHLICLLPRVPPACSLLASAPWLTLSLSLSDPGGRADGRGELRGVEPLRRPALEPWLRAVLPADEHGDAAAHDVEARPLLLHQARAPARERRLRRAPARRRGAGAAGTAPADRRDVPHARRSLQQRVPAAGSRDAPAAVVPALLGELPLLVHVQLHGPMDALRRPWLAGVGS